MVTLTSWVVREEHMEEQHREGERISIGRLMFHGDPYIVGSENQPREVERISNGRLMFHGDPYVMDRETQHR